MRQLGCDIDRPTAFRTHFFKVGLRQFGDEFTLALTFINDGKLRTLPIAIRLFQGQHSSQWGLVFAASLIALVPVLLAYVFFQRAFIRTVDTGAVKG